MNELERIQKQILAIETSDKLDADDYKLLEELKAKAEVLKMNSKLTNEEVVMKIDNKEEFSENELRDLVWDRKRIYEEELEEHKWTKTMLTVIEICGRYFGIY